MIGPTAEKIRDREDRSTSSSGRQEVIEAVRRLIPSFKDDQVIASFGGLRPKIEGDDFYIHEDMEGLINIIGTQSPGLTAAPAISEYVVKLIAHKLSLRPKRPYSPSPSEIIRFRQCNVAERNGLIKKDPYFGEVICRCEMVTKGEIKEAIRMGARTMDGIKFRTRAQMGRCQGSFCTMKVMAILAEELAVPYDSITKRGRGSELVKGYV